MKNLLLVALLFSSFSALADGTHTLGWDDESDTVFMWDGEHLQVTLPYFKGAVPTAVVQDSSNANCSVEIVKYSKKSGFVLDVYYAESEGEDGWNGCTINISRNHSQDEDGTGIVYLEVGHNIDS